MPLTPEKVLDLILAALQELVNCELAVVLGFDSDAVLKVRKAVGPLYTNQLENFSINLKHRRDIAGIISDRATKLFDEDEAHVDTYHGVLEMPNNHSCLVAPLYVENAAIGLLTLDHRLCDQFTPEVVRFVSSVSKLISVALAQTDASHLLIQKTQNLLLERNILLGSNSNVFQEMVGSSRAWTSVLDSIKLVAASDAPVLISGETGTGKEQAARTIHRLSARAEKPFVAVNCSALVQSLAESELFGHEKGAFSGAISLRKGRFELANGGTLFLDEVGDLPIDLQPKLLRVLQDGIFERVGGEKSIKVDVRVLAATNVDLAESTERGNFREDLLYRLDVFPIRLPPLRSRDEDAALLAEHFVAKMRGRRGFETVFLAKTAIDRLLSLPWYGNVRELQNVIERAAILARGGNIEADHIVPGTRERILSMKNNTDSVDTALIMPAVQPLDDTIRYAIKNALHASGGKIYGKDGAAKKLDLKPSTLQSKMVKLGIVYSPL